MRKIIWVSLVLVLVGSWGVACTKHNPAACCSSADQCSSFGLSGVTACEGTDVCNSNGACVAPMCTTNTDCTDPSTPYCNNGFCVAMCGSDGDCTDPSTPFCEGNLCVAKCGSDADCGGGTPYCLQPKGACVACDEDSQCSAQSPVCDGSANSCRGCVADSECASGICLESNGTCADASSAVFVSSTGGDFGTCPQTQPCLTLTFAQQQVTGERNIIKIISSSLVVNATPIYIDGYIDGTATVLTGSGSNGMLNVTNGDVVITGVTLAPTDLHAAEVTGGQATFYGDTLNGNVTAVGGTLTVNRSNAEFIRCGIDFSGNDVTPAILTVTRSTVIDEVQTNGCAVSLQQNDFDETSLGPSNDQTQIEVQGSASVFHIENNIVVSECSYTDPVILQGATGSTYRFNTEVNLSGSDATAQPLSCSGSIDASNNILAWHSSATLACNPNYTLLDQLQGLPPGAGNRIGSAASFFVDFANKNFHLANGSPAIGMGSAGEVGVTVDYDNAPRPNPAGSSPDVGAFESPM